MKEDPPVTEAELEATFPEIEWHEPIEVGVVGYAHTRFACRYCIALYGLRARDHERLFDTFEAARDHIRSAHDVPQ